MLFTRRPDHRQIVTHKAWLDQGHVFSMGHPDFEYAPAALCALPIPKSCLACALPRCARLWAIRRKGLALESGIARSYLGGVERGQRNICLVNICRLAKTLKVSPAALMEFEGAHKD